MAQTTPSLSVESRKSEFVPVTGGRETTSAEGLLVAAYVLMWVVVFGFVWATFRRQRTSERRIAELEHQLAAEDGRRGG